MSVGGSLASERPAQAVEGSESGVGERAAEPSTSSCKWAGMYRGGGEAEGEEEEEPWLRSEADAEEGRGLLAVGGDEAEDWG